MFRYFLKIIPDPTSVEPVKILESKYIPAIKPWYLEPTLMHRNKGTYCLWCTTYLC